MLTHNHAWYAAHLMHGMSHSKSKQQTDLIHARENGAVQEIRILALLNKFVQGTIGKLVLTLCGIKMRKLNACVKHRLGTLEWSAARASTPRKQNNARGTCYACYAMHHAQSISILRNELPGPRLYTLRITQHMPWQSVLSKSCHPHTRHPLPTLKLLSLARPASRPASPRRCPYLGGLHHGDQVVRRVILTQLHKQRHLGYL